jgi:hypothetical protein
MLPLEQVNIPVKSKQLIVRLGRFFGFLREILHTLLHEERALLLRLVPLELRNRSGLLAVFRRRPTRYMAFLQLATD